MNTARKIINWTARALGIVELVGLLGVVIYSLILMFPVSEETAPASLFLIFGGVLLILFTISFLVALRREITGGVLYLVFIIIILAGLLMVDIRGDGKIAYTGQYFFYSLAALPGVLFIFSGLIKKMVRKTVK